jgi:pilus assembly protein CpaB
MVALGLAAYFFMATLSAPPPEVVAGPTQIVEEKKAKILVAKMPIGMGQRLTEGTVEWQDWPEGAVREQYITEAALPKAIEQMQDAVARFEFFPGEPILEAKLVHSNQGYLSAVLPQGKRAVSVRVSASSASGGFIFPNDRVDLVLSRVGSSGPTSETLLENVKVLAIDRRLGEAGTTGAPADPENPKADIFQASVIATLELDPGQGETVINSTRLGTISLVLRSIADYADTGTADPTRSANRPIRMIRFGKGQDILSGSSDAAVAEASFDSSSVDEQPVEEEPPPDEVPVDEAPAEGQ